jgi:hypothetical protein
MGDSLMPLPNQGAISFKVGRILQILDSEFRGRLIASRLIADMEVRIAQLSQQFLPPPWEVKINATKIIETGRAEVMVLKDGEIYRWWEGEK